MLPAYPALECLKIAAFNDVAPRLFNDPVQQFKTSPLLRDKIQKHVYSSAPHELVTDTPSLYLMAERMSYGNTGHRVPRQQGGNTEPWLPLASARPFVSPSILQSFNAAAGSPILRPDPQGHESRTLLHYPATDLRHMLHRTPEGGGTGTLFYHNENPPPEAVRRRADVDAFLRNLRADEAGLRGHLQLNRSDLDQLDAMATPVVPKTLARPAAPRGFKPLTRR